MIFLLKPYTDLFPEDHLKKKNLHIFTTILHLPEITEKVLLLK